MVISEESVMRRLQDVHSASQEAVETISLWIMHYKDKTSIDIIVNGWKRCFISANEKQRIALFYIMNDVVQKAKNKHLDYLIPAFQPAVLSAIPAGRNSKDVRNVMERCVDIFENRQVFTKATIIAMKNLLANGEVGDADEGLELDSNELCNKIEAFEKSRKATENMMTHLQKGWKKYSKDATNNMIDRQHAYDKMKETETILNSVISMRHSMETQKKKQLELVEALVLAQRFHAKSLKEVTVVEDAYQKFYQSVRDVQKELMDMEQTGVYPAATPPRDAPSPTANDDIYATGVETVLNNLRVPGSRDNHETADMEVDDDDPCPSEAPPFQMPTSFTSPPPTIRVGSTGGCWAVPPAQMISPNIPPPGMFNIPPPVMTPQAAQFSNHNVQQSVGFNPNDPRQAFQTGGARQFSVPPPFHPPDVINQPLQQPSTSFGYQGLKDPRQVNQRLTHPPPRAPYQVQGSNNTNPNLIPLGGPTAPAVEPSFNAPYKQTPQANVSSNFFGNDASQSHDDNLDQIGYGDHVKQVRNEPPQWRNDDHQRQVHHEGYRGRRDDGRGHWGRPRGGWDQRRGGRGAFRGNRERDQFYRGDRGNYDGGSHKSYSGDSGSQM